MNQRPKIAVLKDAAYRPSQEPYLLHRIEESGFSVEWVSSIDDVFHRCGSSRSRRPAALMRWEENGGLYGELAAYQRLTRFLYEHRIAPITIDFAFWDHYNGLTLETVGIQNESSIYAEWEELASEIDFQSIPGRTGDAIRRIRTMYAMQRGSDPIYDSYTVAVFNQCALRRSRIGTTVDHSEWNQKIHSVYGQNALFKSMPSPPLDGFRHPPAARVVHHDPDRPLVQNANVAAHAQYCLTNSSGVLNEFVVTDTPVVVTGHHRYTDLQVFYEMRYWEDLAEKSEMPGWRPPLRSIERSKFIDWHLQHQCLHGEPSQLLRRLVEKFHACSWEETNESRPPALDHNHSTLDPPVRKPGVCFMTGVDAHLEDLLPWWHENLRRVHPNTLVVFADFGMSENMRSWCSDRGELLTIGPHPEYAWHNKPLAIWQCPYETRCWLDVDCEVRKSLGFIFENAAYGINLTEDTVRGETWEYALGRQPVATGVIGVCGNHPTLRRWAELSRQAVFRGDQESLNALLKGQRNHVQLLPPEYQWLRLQGPPPDHARVVHWTGPDGKQHIRRMLGR